METRRTALIAVFSVAALLAAVPLFPPIYQDPKYHDFADTQVTFGIRHFWNVISNLGFLVVAGLGVAAFRSGAGFIQHWERIAYGTLLGGVAFVAIGSGYYHLYPNNATLFWDRLPMTIVFMSLLGTTIGERMNMVTGRIILPVLLTVGLVSVLYWRLSGDLRLYGAVQFGTMLLLPLMILLLGPRYSGTAGIWWMIGLYAAAKVFELFDHEIVCIFPAGGHPLKHVAGALAMLCYVKTVERRRPVFPYR